ncbi:coiled-coil domain-containing protein 14 isoform X1 [Acipenser ruthenus]|uniref:coiled-coil domain-containing protein 14 isoform X1 n=1 Tax=Acipenser ruthenus TaxID=7906 RepID=UPI002742557D|nr:coiled-coil domain-containing protein 14 isoform X1 [Acipenser ruthenus]
MARQGLNKPRKVVSSGRLAGSAKAIVGNKRIVGRKPSAASVDSGYSLYSTDSEDQVTTIHKGLDRCAALLQGILQTEKSDVKPSCSKPGKVTASKLKTKVTFGKGENGRRKDHHKTGSVTQKGAVEKVNLFSSTNPVMKEKRCLNTAQSPNGQPVFIPVPQPSPEAQPALTDDVQTQMSVLNCQAAMHGAPLTQPVYAGADSGKQSSTVFNRRLTTSTPALSPQHSANPLCIPTSMSNDDVYSHGSPQGGINYFPVYAGPATAIPSMQPAHTTPAVFTFPPPAVSSGNEVQGVPQQMYGTEAGFGQSNRQLLKEHKLLRHLSHLQQQEAENRQPAVPINSQTRIQLSSEESESEHSEGNTSEDDDLDCVDITPVKDTSCQTSFDNQRLLKTKKMSPEQTKKKVATVKYLLGELKALVADQADSEVHRLIREVEESVSLLPTVIGSTNVQAEIALALQPQRSENAQLRRRLRIVNQQLKERERAEKESRSVDCNFEIISLQSMNMTLQTQLKEAHRSVELLQKKNEELLKVIDDQREKNKQLLTVMQEKEVLLQNRQQYEVDTARVRIDVDEALSKMKSFQFKFEASEKENQILSISLQQRDAEINRLRELTRTLQGSMTRLLSELNTDNNRSKAGSHLTKTILELYENQQKVGLASDPVTNSVHLFLNTLETDQWGSSPVNTASSNKNSNVESIYCYANESAGTSWNKGSTISSSERFSPSNQGSITRQVAESESDGCFTLRDKPKLDETTYVPVISSSKKQALEVRKKTPPLQSDSVLKRLDYSNEIHAFESVQCDESKPLTNAFEKLTFSRIEPFSYISGESNVPENSSQVASRIEGQIPVRPLGTMDTFRTSITGNKREVPQINKRSHSSLPLQRNGGQMYKSRIAAVDSTFSTFDGESVNSDWSLMSASTFNTGDEQDFRNGLAALDASIANLQKTIQTDLKR